jgi:flavin reductase (DIM6/NTAB) family NADH-FMN oxidoreductase RutF
MKTVTEGEAMALAAPHPYTLVTSLDKNGKPNALGVSWLMRTSIKPFLMLVSIDHRRYSHEGINLHKEYVINFPSEEQAAAAMLCGVKSGRDMDKIKETGLELIDSLKVKVPTIKGSAVAFECKVVDSFETGDHTVFVGKVVATRANPEKTKHLFLAGGYDLISLDSKKR